MEDRDIQEDPSNEDVVLENGEETEGSPSPETGGAEDQSEKVVPKSDPLEEAKKEAEVYKDRWMRLAAEFENYKKRISREFETLVGTANEDVLRDLLPVLDSVDRALAHGGEEQDEGEEFREGVKMIMQQLPKLLQNRGLSEIDALGKQFDPYCHEALMQVDSDEYDSGTVAEVAQKGYCLGKRVLRATKVVVSRGKAEAQQEIESGKDE